jgi:hypothetical protein
MTTPPDGNRPIEANLSIVADHRAMSRLRQEI